MTSHKFQLIFPATFFFAFFALVQSADAATYYISPSANPGETACSLNAPCDICDDADAKADVTEIIVRGGTYHNKCRIDTDGVYLHNFPGEIPVFDGEFVRPVLVPQEFTGNNFKKHLYPAYADAGNDALIDIRANNSITEGLTAYRSSATGIRVGASSVNRIQHATVRNCKSDWTMSVALQLYHSDDTIIENSEFSRGAYLVPTYCDGNWGCCDNHSPCQRIDPSITTARNDLRPIYRNNVVRDSWHEGFNLDENVRDAIVEHNVMYGNWKYQVYFANNYRNTFRWNLVYRTLVNANGQTTNPGSGFSLNAENAGLIQGDFGPYWVYGNVIAGDTSAFNISVYCPDTSTDPASACYHASDTSIQTNTAFVYNNLFINTGTDKPTVTLGPTVADNAPLSITVDFRNNVVWNTVGGTPVNGNSNLTKSNNMWSSLPAAQYRGSGDLTDTPDIARTVWNNLVAGVVQVSDARSLPGSNMINAGAVIAGNANYAIGINGVNRGSSAWDIGPYEYFTVDTTAPGSPSGLSVR